MPQIGAVLVPINFRLAAEEFQYLITHSGATVVCADADYLAAVDRIRPALPGVRHFVALSGARDGWLDYEGLLAAAAAEPKRPPVDERDLLTINYTSGTTSRPKGVMITHRNAWVNIRRHAGAPADDGGRPLPVDAADVPRQRLDASPGSVTAVGARHVCLPKVDPAAVFRLIADEGVTFLCAAPTVLIGWPMRPTRSRPACRAACACSPPARRRRRRRFSASRKGSAGR